MAFRDLRQLYGVLDTSLHAVAARAVQIVEWDRTHRFCGACGAPTAAHASERSRVCTACGLAQFPRIAPAVIVAVEKGDEILLGRSGHFPPGIYSVLAGFVEPGESLEAGRHARGARGSRRRGRGRPLLRQPAVALSRTR